MPAQRPALQKPGPTPLREADIDDIEVLRDDGFREDRARLTDDFGPEVAIREVCEREQSDSGGLRELGSGRRRRVQGLVCARLLLDGESRLMDEDVGVSGCLENRAGRARVAGENDLSAGPGRPENLRGAHRGSIRELHHLSGLEAAEQGALGDAETLRGLEVEATRARFLDERVAVGRDAVLHGERLDLVVGPLDGASRTELDERELVTQPPEHAAEDSEQILEPRGPVDGQRNLAPPESERLQHPRQAEVMVRVVVREEDLRQLDEPHGGPKQLSLGSLAAVDEDPLAATTE